ncbi:MAG TPA: energy transducer TonB [Pyrinomonadaceae bacterium]|nr:energy transducer TonB [Pyrinomonadaceae bacterium]
MHDCETTRARLADMLFGELGGGHEAALLAELGRCAECAGEHRVLAATLSAFDTASEELLPGGEFWPGYGERLRERMAQEIRPDIWRQGAAAFGLPAFEYRLTFIEDEGLPRRLAQELREAARESRLNWPEFRRDPFGFTRRSAAAYSRLAYRFFSQRDVALGTFASLFCVTVLVGAIFAVENRCSVLGLFSRPCEMAPRNPHADLELVGMVPATGIPREQPDPDEGPAGMNEGRGGGSKPEYERPRGGGGGGLKEQLPPSHGKLPTAQLAPVIVPPNPYPPAVKNPSLPTPVTIDLDPMLSRPDLSATPYGDPKSNSTVASAGPGTGGGIGEGSGGGVGPGEGGGLGPGEGGNTGGDTRREGGGGPGGNRGGGGPAINYVRPFEPREVSQRARIVSKPEPGFTEEARRENVTGTVRLRAVLSASGAVTNISVLKGLPAGLTEKAIAAARNIKFQPAQKDGRAVSQWVTLEYNFNIY